jgi:hypothetical protein
MAFPVVNGTEVLLPPPEGWTVNFAHPYRDDETKRNVLVAFGIEFPIATLFLLQRIYTSCFILRRFLIDDCKCLAPVLCLPRTPKILTQPIFYNRHDYHCLGMTSRSFRLHLNLYLQRHEVSVLPQLLKP